MKQVPPFKQNLEAQGSLQPSPGIGAMSLSLVGEIWGEEVAVATEGSTGLGLGLAVPGVGADRREQASVRRGPTDGPTKVSVTKDVSSVDRAN